MDGDDVMYAGYLEQQIGGQGPGSVVQVGPCGGGQWWVLMSCSSSYAVCCMLSSDDSRPTVQHTSLIHIYTQSWWMYHVSGSIQRKELAEFCPYRAVYRRQSNKKRTVYELTPYQLRTSIARFGTHGLFGPWAFSYSCPSLTCHPE